MKRFLQNDSSVKPDANKIVMATNEAGYNQFLADCENEGDCYEICLGFFGLFDKEKFTGFFGTEKEVRGYAARGSSQTTRTFKAKSKVKYTTTEEKYFIRYDEIEKISRYYSP